MCIRDRSYIAYAEQIARASGGILRMLAVSKEECIFIGLPMIDPIFYNDIEDEEEWCDYEIIKIAIQQF